MFRAHRNTAICPFMRAAAHVFPFQGHSLARAYWRISRCPFMAALAHVRSSQGRPSDRAHWSTARCPPSAAYAQRLFLNISLRGSSIALPITSATRAALAAASGPRVRVTFPRSKRSSPGTAATAAPAAAHFRHTRRNHRPSPAGTARATFSRSSGGSPSAQARPGGAPPGARGDPDPPPPAPAPAPPPSPPPRPPP